MIDSLRKVTGLVLRICMAAIK